MTPTTIEKIHLLVHPGYVIKRHNIQEAIAQIPGNPFTALMDKYRGKASSLGAAELMVLFAPRFRKTFVKEVRAGTEAYVQLIHDIKTILGDRLIVLADSDEHTEGAVFEENKDHIWQKIKKIAEGRGFTIGDNLTSEAYGEHMNSCVAAVADNMNAAMELAEPTEIIADLTDYSIYQGTKAYEDIDEVRRGGATELPIRPGAKIKFR
jgi:hypothetical protein